MQEDVKGSLDRWLWSSSHLQPISLHIVGGQDRDLGESRGAVKNNPQAGVSGGESPARPVPHALDLGLSPFQSGGGRNLAVGSRTACREGGEVLSTRTDVEVFTGQ